MVRRSVVVGRNDGGGRIGGGIIANHHGETLGDPFGWGDPHDRRGALNFDDPKMKLS